MLHALLQGYLHLVDASRDRALMNKSDSLLVPACGLPAGWFVPERFKGLSKNSKGVWTDA